MLALTSLRHLSHLTECPFGLSAGDMAHVRNHRVKAIAVNVVAVVLRLFLGGFVCFSPGSASGCWCFVPGSPNGGWHIGGSCWVPPILDSVSEVNSLQLLAELFIPDWVAWILVPHYRIYGSIRFTCVRFRREKWPLLVSAYLLISNISIYCRTCPYCWHCGLFWISLWKWLSPNLSEFRV